MNFLTRSAISLGLFLFCNAHLFCESISYQTLSDANSLEAEFCVNELYAKGYPEEVYAPRKSNLNLMLATNTSYSKGMIRDYRPLTPGEQKEITYIVDTLGNSSLIAIARARGAIEKSGSDVDHVHPLQFLAHIFSDEK